MFQHRNIDNFYVGHDLGQASQLHTPNKALTCLNQRNKKEKDKLLVITLHNHVPKLQQTIALHESIAHVSNEPGNSVEFRSHASVNFQILRERWTVIAH